MSLINFSSHAVQDGLVILPKFSFSRFLCRVLNRILNEHKIQTGLDKAFQLISTSGEHGCLLDITGLHGIVLVP